VKKALGLRSIKPLVMTGHVADHHMDSEAFGRGIFEFKTNITPQEFPRWRHGPVANKQHHLTPIYEPIRILIKNG